MDRRRFLLLLGVGALVRPSEAFGMPGARAYRLRQISTAPGGVWFARSSYRVNGLEIDL